MTQHIFSFESELQNNQNEVAPSSPNFSLSVSEKLSRYGVNALSDVEHLGLLVGKETLAARLLKHFGSLKALTKASAVELGTFMTTHKAERLVAALAVSARAQAQNSFQELSTVQKPFIDPVWICRPSNKKCCELFYSTLVFAGSPQSISEKAPSMNHSLILEKSFGPQSPILPMPL